MMAPSWRPRQVLRMRRMRYASGIPEPASSSACKGHTQGIGRLAFTPDGKTLVSISSDSSLRFWNVSTQQELLAMKRIADPVQDLLFSPDGNWLILKTLSGLRLLNAAANA